MSNAQSISDHWGTGDVYHKIVVAMRSAGISPETVTIEELAPVDHFHARGFPATVELADALPIANGQRLVDIGCGLGGPARHLSERFGCKVKGVEIQHGDGQKLPYADGSFDGGYTQHVTMNVPDRPAFFAEAFRVLKPGAFFALTEHGLGEVGDPHHPVPWSEDGSGAYLMGPADTVAKLEDTGFADIEVTDTGEKYFQGYLRAIKLADNGEAPAFGVHIILGKLAPQIVGNAARNIKERRTHLVQIICRMPG